MNILVNLRHSKIYLCNFHTLAESVFFLKITKLPLFLLHIFNCFVDKDGLLFKHQIVNSVIFCYTKKINKLYDAKTSDSV